LAGILRYGSYVPYFRLQRAATGSGRGERAVASYDEDALSMAVEASREALRDGAKPDAVVFASTAPPYAEKLAAATLATACNLPHEVRTLDVGGSTRMGAGALLLGDDLARSGASSPAPTSWSAHPAARASATAATPRSRSCSGPMPRPARA
jgi:3-hydroxy-3-methylglutaryl CoA synthase